MNLKKTAKMGVLLAASAALVVTLLNDKKQKQEADNTIKVEIED